MGDTQEDVSSDVLMETRITLKTPNECRELASQFKEYNENSMICGFRKNYDACQVRINSNLNNCLKLNNF